MIVSFHWGVEYKDNANAEQIKVAHRCIDAGADMVLAHHPHVIQGLEIYKKRLIAYSLGDFVFDHYSRKTGESFILNADMGPNGVDNIKVTPTYLDGYGRPAVVKGPQADAILTRLKKISKPHGTTVRHPRRHREREAMREPRPGRPSARPTPPVRTIRTDEVRYPDATLTSASRRPAGALPRRDGRRG